MEQLIAVSQESFGRQRGRKLGAKVCNPQPLPQGRRIPLLFVEGNKPTKQDHTSKEQLQPGNQQIRCASS